MAYSHSGTNHLTRDTPPSPASLCPRCGNADNRDRLYFRSGANEAVYTCINGHGWLVRWAVA